MSKCGILKPFKIYLHCIEYLRYTGKHYRTVNSVQVPNSYCREIVINAIK